METTAPYTQLLRSPGATPALRIEAAPTRTSWTFAVAITVDAHPFSGTVDATLRDTDLRAFAAGLRDTSVPRTVSLGGDRAAELALQVRQQRGAGDPDARAIEAFLTRSGDDPFPSLRWLMFDNPLGFGQPVADRIEQFLAEHGT